MNREEWCDKIAVLAVDALADRHLIQRENLEESVKLASKEIFVRLCLNDYPPPF